MALIKRYANRKLYHCEAGHYITLEEITALVRKGEDLRVVDHASGRDLTGVVLLQAVLEEEKRLGEMLPQVVLTRLLAAFDPERHFADQLNLRMQHLVRAGEISSEEGVRLVDRLLRVDPSPVEDEAFREDPQAADVSSIEDLHRIVEDLEDELARLRGSS